MRALLRRLARLERRLTTRTDHPAPARRQVCERCGLLVETACWHRHCPLAEKRP